MFFYLFIALLLAGCSTQQETRPPWQTIQGRDRTVTQPLYRVRAPLDWVRENPADDADLSDTTLPIVTFYIRDVDPDSPIRVTLHTFPYTQPEARIPPEAQVARWQRQTRFSGASDKIKTFSVTPVSHGGFHGLFFETESVMAWSMKIGDPYEQLFQAYIPSTPYTRALRADYTIKATLPPEGMKHRDALIAFARSFEWIEEMPQP